MINGSDDIFDSDGILGSDAPSDRDDRWLGSDAPSDRGDRWLG
jgi:hypothetical protein